MMLFLVQYNKKKIVITKHFFDFHTLFKSEIIVM